MGRRIEFAGATHHVTTRSPSKRLLFESDGDAQRYLRRLSTTAIASAWVVHSFCLMHNHVHLLVTTPQPNLGAGLKEVHEDYARWTNRLRGQHGALFGRRFENRLVLTEDHFAACMRYIARNPVAAKLVDLAESWPWSAHAMLVGQVPAPAFLDPVEALRPIGTSFAAARTAYAAWVPQPDAAVLDALRGDPQGLTKAAEQHRIPVSTIAAHLGCTERTVYRRLSAERVTHKSDL